MKQFLVLFLFLCSASVFAQDVIVKKEGSTIVCRVVELTSSEIVYKKWSDLNGSNYVMNRTDASAINYQNGKRVNLSEATNLYTPNNQNDGKQQYNDRELLALDASAAKLPKKVKKLRTIGLVGGAIVVGVGGIVMLTAPSDKGYDEQMIKGGVIMGCGVVGATICLLKAQSYKRQMDMLQVSSIYQYNYEFSNGSNLSAGIDMLRDHNIGNNTLGIGLRYNF